MANKRDVLEAYYRGVCDCLQADHEGSLVGNLEIDMTELVEFIDRNPEYEDLRIYTQV